MTGLLSRGDLAVLEGLGLDGQLLLEVGVLFIPSGEALLPNFTQLAVSIFQDREAALNCQGVHSEIAFGNATGPYAVKPATLPA